MLEVKKGSLEPFFIKYVIGFSLPWHSFHFLCHPTLADGERCDIMEVALVLLVMLFFLRVAIDVDNFFVCFR